MRRAALPRIARSARSSLYGLGRSANAADSSLGKGWMCETAAAEAIREDDNYNGVRVTVA